MCSSVVFVFSGLFPKVRASYIAFGGLNFFLIFSRLQGARGRMYSAGGLKTPCFFLLVLGVLPGFLGNPGFIHSP